MGKKKKRRPGSSTTEPAGSEQKAPERLSSPFRDSLAGLKKQLAHEQGSATRPKKEVVRPPEPSRKPHKALSEDEETALSLAMQGVVPLSAKATGQRVVSAAKVPSRTAQVAPFAPSAEAEARARLDALVAQGANFRVEREGELVRAVRVQEGPRLPRELSRRTRAEASLDLHGMHQREAREAVSSFVRKAHKQGLELLCIVHGKGIHSEDGVGVLREVAVDALLQTGAAPLVRAFTTAPDVLGGSGALLVLLVR